MRVLNQNLARETEIAKGREAEARVFGQENRSLKKLLEDGKEDYASFKGDQGRLNNNLRIQMDETKDMIDRIREQKDRELNRLTERFEENRRKQAQQYQFEYDKLREEMQLFARKLGQEENLNKQLSMLNYKLQNNLGDVGKGFAMASYDEEAQFMNGKKATFGVDEDLTDEMYQRKKAWADLEREGDEIKHNIKSLMRRDPKSTKIDNPALVGGVSLKKAYEGGTVYRVPQDIVLEQRHGAQLSDFKPSAKLDLGEDNSLLSKEPAAKSGRRANIYGSNTDLSIGRDSSNSKARGTSKRQWKAPAENVKEVEKFEAIQEQNREQPVGFGHSGNFGNEFQEKQDKFDGDFLKERGLFGNELPA